MPGNCTSCVNIAVPFDFAAASTRGARLPMNTYFDGSFGVTLDGAGIAAASCASSPKFALRPDECDTTPAATVTVSACTFQRLAAAATSIARAVAPAVRSWSHEFAIAVEPPVPCAGPHIRLL